jgi:pimeloyl-ACP methyl ester carboxylesterase
MLENFESLIKDETDKQIELYYRCSYKTEHVEFPRTPSDYLKVKEYKKVIAFFIGGAGDKTPFLGVGPNGNIKEVMDKFIVKNNSVNYIPLYRGYDEVYGEANIKKEVLSQIPDKRASIYIVGHSLGGWNAAHLSQILTDKGCKVKMLVTIDPVGLDAIVNGSSKMYWATPKPKADFWINIYVDPKNYNFPDFIADSGKRWKPNTNSPNVFHTTSISHEDAEGIFIEKTSTGKSAFDYMLNSVTITLK